MKKSQRTPPIKGKDAASLLDKQKSKPSPRPRASRSGSSVSTPDDYTTASSTTSNIVSSPSTTISPATSHRRSSAIASSQEHRLSPKLSSEGSQHVTAQPHFPIGLPPLSTSKTQNEFLQDSPAAPASLGQQSLRKSISEDSDRTIRENISPNLEQSFSSPLSGVTTTSTTPTVSARTFQGSDVNPQNSNPARTPSYPFPYMPRKSSKPGRIPFHQPFTALSPTSQASDQSPGTSNEEFLAQGGRRISYIPDFPPYEEEQEQNEEVEEQFPSPALYEAVLEINCESMLEGWWSKMIDYARNKYHINRMSLALPVDLSDLEGVQWGQKLTYNANGFKAPQSSANQSTINFSTSQSTGTQLPPINKPTRPSIESRHSFAGYEMTRNKGDKSSSAFSTTAFRPTTLRRVTSQTATNVTDTSIPLAESGLEETPLLNVTQHDSESSERQGIQDKAQHHLFSAIYQTLRPLDMEPDPLLEPAGVNRIIERGSIVLLTRDFSTEHGLDETRNKESRKSFSKSRTSSVVESQTAPGASSVVYEDFEQVASTPWSASPAPSPAIQNDPERNPFFNNEESTDTTFSPQQSPQDYSSQRSIPAIGVDNACTIIHVPLIHPSLSKPNPSLEQETSLSERNSIKMPIAILSMSSALVPYPENLAQSINNFAPHLATSFNTCSKNSYLQNRVINAIHDRQLSGHFLDLFPGLDLGSEIGFDSLFNDVQDMQSSALTSVTSPSEHSGSVVSTPGVDPAPPSSGPKGYFDNRKRTSFEGPRGSNVAPQSQDKIRHSPRTTSREHRSTLPNIESRPHGKEAAPQPPISNPDVDIFTELPDTVKTTHAAKPDIQHSVLHSYGADFKASFQAIPSTAVPKTSIPTSNTRNTTSPEAFAMPPPSERLLRMIIDGLPVQIFTAAPITGKLTWVNSKFLHYRGLSAEKIIADPWDTIHEDDLHLYLQAWSKSLHTGNQFQQKVRLRRYDDSYRYFYVRASPLRTNEQKIVHWLGTMFDFHDQHIAEAFAARQQETAASESKYRALANSSPQIVFACNKKQGITFCNTQWTAYSGQTEQQARGLGFHECIHPDDLEKCKLPIIDEEDDDDDGDENLSVSNVPVSVRPRSKQKPSGTSAYGSSDDSPTTVITSPISPTGRLMPQRKLSELANVGILRVSKDAAGKTSYSTEVRLKSKAGEYKWHLVRVLLADSLIQSEAQEETWYGTCTDISDHKELERSLKEAMEAKSNFLSNMSHEIRTPLNGIWGMTNFLIDTKLNAEQLDQVNIIRSSTEGLRDLINDILDLSKVEAGMINLNQDWFNIRLVIEEVNDITCPLALDKGIELNYLVEDSVPEVVKGDKFRFRQILINVIGNGIKFTDVGEVFIHCTVASKPPPGFPQEESVLLELQVRDTGRGFSEQEAERLFKRFSQIDGSSTRQHGGSGLGLVISMQLAELHGGEMTASSTLGKGSTFSFTIKFGIPSEIDPLPLSGREARTGLVHNTSLDSFDIPPSKQSLSATSQLSPLTQTVLGSPSTAVSLSPSSAGSEHSAITGKTSLRSPRSSQSSKVSMETSALRLELQSDTQSTVNAGSSSSLKQGPGGAKLLQPKIYSILVICPLPWTMEATVGHLHSILPTNVTHMVTSRSSLSEVQELFGGENTIIFSHIVLAIPDTDVAGELIDYIFTCAPSSTELVVISDMKQKNLLLSRSGKHDLRRLASENRLKFIPKPVKPSKLAIVFDTTAPAELSTDVNQSSAQQVAINQRRLFEDMSRRLADKDIRVLLVEDNLINQMVMLKLLQRISLGVETVMDGLQATEKVLSKPHDHYSIILMDLMMPNKDGYETCQDIRQWEKSNGYPPIPIIALSANVLDDVWRKCEETGFNSYLTKPVEFQDLSDILMAFLDSDESDRPTGFMRKRSSMRRPAPR